MIGFVAFSSAPFLACAACFGQSDSPMAQGMNWGILSLLGVIVLVLGGVAGFFVYLARRSSALAAELPVGAKASGCNPFRVDEFVGAAPSVARASQPWAESENPFGVR